MYDPEKRLGRQVVVTFNFRYVPFITEIKKLVESGEIGEVYSIEYQEFLDLEHGASYYRRWHGYRRFNGSLLVTKASHHFDAINWILESDPREVVAYGDLHKYGRNGPFRHTHCRTCPHKETCEFFWDITKSPGDMEMYVACESEDGYLRDACVYREDLDTWDTNSVLIRYESGVQMTYSLTAASPYEGQRVTLTGSKGRILARLYTGRQGWEVPHESRIRLARNRKDPVEIFPEERSGGHAGADPQLKDHIFRPDTTDPLGYRAGSRAGILSSIVGIAACRSIDTGIPVKIEDLIRLA
jgi:predicted dehydrogenase